MANKSTRASTSTQHNLERFWLGLMSTVRRIDKIFYASLTEKGAERHFTADEGDFRSKAICVTRDFQQELLLEVECASFECGVHLEVERENDEVADLDEEQQGARWRNWHCVMASIFTNSRHPQLSYHRHRMLHIHTHELHTLCHQIP